MTPEQTCAQIRRITESLISEGLCRHFAYPRIENGANGWRTVGIGAKESYSFVLRNERYVDIYEALVQDQAYNVLLVEGSMLQMSYEFHDRELVKHRLAYFPRPQMLDLDEIDQEEQMSEVYEEVTARRFVPIPLRFDLDKSVETNLRGEHPHSHFTLGSFEGCRVPVSAPISPVEFTGFILSNFMTRVHRRRPTILNGIVGGFPECINTAESNRLHVRLGL